MATPELRLAPGGRGEIRVTRDQPAGLARCTARPSWSRRSAAGRCSRRRPRASGPTPGEPAVLRFAVAVPATARPGARWWALVKVMYFGRVRYSQAVPVSIEAG